MVSPRRVVHRFLDVTPEEVTNLWLTAQRVGQKIEPFFKATSLTIAILVNCYTFYESPPFTGWANFSACSCPHSP